jgi:exodeoxyribonuclease VII large subunit
MDDLQPTSTDIQQFQNVYSPGTLLGVYANALHTPLDGNIVLAKGVFQPSKSPKEYNGYYYDTIKSPNDNKSITARIPSLLRSKLENNSIYIFKGYVEKRINFSSIELVFVVDDILQKEENQISEEEIKRFELLQKKVTKGFRDFESIVKEHIFNGTVLKIANLYGNAAIVDEDFELGIGNDIIRFSISKHRCNFSSKTDLIASIQRLKVLDYDVIAIVRGGGDKASLEVFNDPELGNEAISINQILVTALGHTVDETMLDKIADKKFALPHDYGNSLKVWVDEATAEQSKSKSIFIDQVKKDLEKTFQDQITTLKNQLESKNKEFETAQLKFKEMVEQNQKDKLETIQAKEKAFEASIKSLTEQIKSKEESLKIIQANNETTTKQQVASAISEFKTKYDIVNSEREKLIRQLDSAANIKNNLVIYIIIAIIAGLIIGLFF